MARSLLAFAAMTAPRRVVPGGFWQITRRCTQRQFLLRPDDHMNNAFLYCLIEAALKFNIHVILPQMMSNHHHTEVYDRDGTVIEFYQRFHTSLARCVNALRGRWENLWSSEPTCLVELETVDDVIEKLVYAATNPVKDGLVERVHHWPGPDTVGALLTGRTLKARRPWWFFRDDGPMPETVELKLTLPEELGDTRVLLGRLRQRIAEVEAACARVRAETKREVFGRGRVLRQSWRDSPTSHEPRHNLRPRIAARSRTVRIEALQRNAEFQLQYKQARSLWLAKLPCVFPAGTCWLRRFANVVVAPFVPRPPIAARA
jgi:putative transposase